MKVACGVMYDTEGRILMGLRDSKGTEPNYWEFPGGTLEIGETLENCLHREWYEELNLGIEIEEYFYTSTLGFVECFFFLGKINGFNNMQINVHDHIGFYDLEDIKGLRLFEGDEKIVDILLQRKLLAKQRQNKN
jgi:8-oxo-dGTP diphosphatase